MYVGFKIHIMAFSCVDMEEVTQHIALYTLDYSIGFPEDLCFTWANNKDVGVVSIQYKFTICGAVNNIINVQQK